MKKLYGLFCGLLLAGMLLVGFISLFDKDATFSQRENRKLQSRPKVTFSALLDGTYTTKFSAYYTDTFPGKSVGDQQAPERLLSLRRDLQYVGGGPEHRGCRPWRKPPGPYRFHESRPVGRDIRDHEPRRRHYRTHGT